MAIARVASQDATGTSFTTSVTATYAATPTQNNLLIAVPSADDFSIAIAGWTQAVSSNLFANGTGHVIYYKIAGAGESTTVTATNAAATIMRLAIFEYSGLVTSSVLDKTVIHDSSSSALLSASTGVTKRTANSDELVIGVVQWASTMSSPIWNNGFNARAAVAGNLFVGDRITVGTGTFESSVTTTGTAGKNSGSIATFKGPAVDILNYEPSLFKAADGISVAGVAN